MAITEARIPRDISGLKKFLGIVSYFFLMFVKFSFSSIKKICVAIAHKAVKSNH